MRPSNDPEPVPEDPENQRRIELARILAVAILRLRDRSALANDESPECGQTGLEVPREAVLSGHHG